MRDSNDIGKKDQKSDREESSIACSIQNNPSNHTPDILLQSKARAPLILVDDEEEILKFSKKPVLRTLMKDMSMTQTQS